jgi:adenylate cyclase
MADIFLSYANEDRDVVAELVQVFQARGWSVWWDRVIAVGTNYETEIEAELDSARCVVAIWSRHSVGSRWVRTEAEDAAQRGMLIPVLIEEVKVPLSVRSLEAARLIGWPNHAQVAEMRKLIDAVDRMLSGGDRKHENATPLASEPTLSERVARRVMQALRDFDRNGKSNG